MDNWHKMGKMDMLTIIYEQEKKIQKLTKEVEELKSQLADRTIQIKKAGSIAEASLKINKIFEVAQQAADEYLKSVKRVNKNIDNVRNKKIYKYKAKKEFNEQISFLVMPKRYEMGFMEEKIARRDLMEQGFEYDGVREYQEGDRISRVHWNLYAVTEALLVKPV